MTTPFLYLHLACAIFAVISGAYLLLNTKGTHQHRAIGWVWAVSMIVVAITSFWLKSPKIPTMFWGLGPIHILAVVTLISVPIALWAAHSHQVKTHKITMVSVYAGGCIAAGLGALAPGRLLHLWMF